MAEVDQEVMKVWEKSLKEAEDIARQMEKARVEVANLEKAGYPVRSFSVTSTGIRIYLAATDTIYIQ